MMDYLRPCVALQNLWYSVYLSIKTIYPEDSRLQKAA